MFGYVPPVPRRSIAWADTGRRTAASGIAPIPAEAVSRLMAREAGRSVAAAVSARVRQAGRGLIIDLDDTLYPRERFVRSGLAAVAHHVSVHHGLAADAAYACLTRASADGHAGNEMQALCDRFGLPVDLIPTLVQVFRTHTPSLFLGTESIEALRRLRAGGWSLAILTNGLPSVQFRKVAALGITTLVDEVIYAEEHAPGGKPSPAPFLAALRSLELDASQCVCVGDDPARDMRGARALGIATVRLARPAVQVEAGDEADVVIDSLRQLPDAASLLLSKVTAHVA